MSARIGTSHGSNALPAVDQSTFDIGKFVHIELEKSLTSLLIDDYDEDSRKKNLFPTEKPEPKIVPQKSSSANYAAIGVIACMAGITGAYYVVTNQGNDAKKVTDFIKHLISIAPKSPFETTTRLNLFDMTLTS